MVSNAQKIAQATMLRDSLNGVGTHQVRIHPGNDPAQIEYMFKEQTFACPECRCALRHHCPERTPGGSGLDQPDRQAGGRGDDFPPARERVCSRCLRSGGCHGWPARRSDAGSRHPRLAAQLLSGDGTSPSAVGSARAPGGPRSQEWETLSRSRSSTPAAGPRPRTNTPGSSKESPEKEKAGRRTTTAAMEPSFVECCDRPRRRPRSRCGGSSSDTVESSKAS